MPTGYLYLQTPMNPERNVYFSVRLRLRRLSLSLRFRERRSRDLILRLK